MNSNIKNLIKKTLIIVAGLIIIFIVIVLYLFQSKEKDVLVNETTTEITTQEETIVIPVDFQSLWQTNDDIVAWIKIEGTNVDYPVLQSDKDMEENYYLNTTPEGNTGYPGSIYIQKKNSSDFSDSVTAIYGHNMANKTMFGSLHLFNERYFFETNNTIYVYTPEKILEYKVFAAYKSDNESIMEGYGDFKEKEKLKEYLEFVFGLEETDLNHIDRSISINENDRIVLLTTCIGNPNYRWRVLGVLID